MPTIRIRMRDEREMVLAARARQVNVKSVLVTETGTQFVFPYAPRQVNAGGFAGTYARVDRYGRNPLLQRAGEPLPEFTATFVLGSNDHQVSIEPELYAIRQMAKTRERITWTYGLFEGGWWRVTNLTIRTLLRQQGTNHVTRAECSMTLTRASDLLVNVGPVTGGAVHTTASASASASTKPQRHTVKSGETMAAVSLKYYGTVDRWREIADVNGVRDSRVVTDGQVLIIP